MAARAGMLDSEDFFEGRKSSPHAKMSAGRSCMTVGFTSGVRGGEASKTGAKSETLGISSGSGWVLGTGASSTTGGLGGTCAS